MRQRVLKRAGVEEAPPWSDDLEVMESGNFYHAAHAARLKRAGALAVDEEGTTMSEYALKDEHTSGRLDFLVRHEGELCLVDLKTTAQSSFEYRKRENAAQPHHMMQLCRYYLKLAGTPNKPDFGMIVYIGRDYGNKLEFPVQWTEELLRDTMKDITDEVTAWQIWEDRKELPDELPLENKKGKIILGMLQLAGM